MKDINVLFLTSWYPNKIKPQNGNFIKRHAMAVSHFCTVSVIHVSSAKQIDSVIIEKQKKPGLFEWIAYYKKGNRNIPLISPVIRFYRYYKAFKKTYNLVLNEFKTIDIVHLNVIFPAGFFALFLNIRYKIPFIITEHWTKFLSISSSKFTFLERFFIKQISKKASVICPVSDDLKTAMHKFGIHRPYNVIPNVVDTDIFFPIKNKRNSDKIRILHVSHLDDKHKNISGILNVIKKLSREREDFQITISGNRNLDVHKKYAREINIPEELISFEGSKTLSEVAESMRQHDLFLLFSNYENLPCVISEAHVSGIPVISSDVGGVSEMIEKDNGVLVEPNNENDLYNKLMLILNNINAYNSQQISEKAKSRYSTGTVGSQYYNLYKKVLKLE